MTDRPSWSEHWFAHAAVEAQRATCSRLKVGAVIIDRHQRMIGAGWNGAPSGLPHCTAVGCLIEPETGRCKRTVHAEINALLSTSPEARRDGVMYCTAKPCESCTMAILNSGLAAVYYRDDYPIAQQLRESVAQIIGDGRVEFTHWTRGEEN